MSDIEIIYDINRIRSNQVYPKKSRQPLSSIALSSPVRIVRTALNAAEKELKHVMGVANQRLETIAMIRKEKSSAIKDIIVENIKSGSHLIDEVFIPEYLGFIDVPPEGDNAVRVYSRDGYGITRLDDRWLIISPDGLRVLVMIKNMHDAVIILEAMGVDVNFKDYMEGAYVEGISIDDAVKVAVDRVLEAREIAMKSLPEKK